MEQHFPRGLSADFQIKTLIVKKKKEKERKKSCSLSIWLKKTHTPQTKKQTSIIDGASAKDPVCCHGTRAVASWLVHLGEALHCILHTHTVLGVSAVCYALLFSLIFYPDTK